jgi:hypothetical protein
MRTLVNFVLFQAGWFACVLGAARGVRWLPPIAVAVVVVVHLAVRRQRGREILLLAIAAVFGAAADSALIAARFYQPVRWFLPAPATALWLILMWVNFATTMTGCLAWLQGRRLLGAVLGAVGGPMTYYAGERLNALALARPLSWGLGGIAVLWAIAVPLLAELALRLNRPTRFS